MLEYASSRYRCFCRSAIRLPTNIVATASTASSSLRNAPAPSASTHRSRRSAASVAAAPRSRRPSARTRAAPRSQPSCLETHPVHKSETAPPRCGNASPASSSANAICSMPFVRVPASDSRAPRESPRRFVLPATPYSQLIPYSTSADENTLSRKYLSVASPPSRSRRGKIQNHVRRNADQLQRQKQRHQIVRRGHQIRARQNRQQAGMRLGRVAVVDLVPQHERKQNAGRERQARAYTTRGDRCETARRAPIRVPPLKPNQPGDARARKRQRCPSDAAGRPALRPRRSPATAPAKTARRPSPAE